MFTAHYPFYCSGCGTAFPAGVEAEYNSEGSLVKSGCTCCQEGIGDLYYGAPEKQSREIPVMPRGKTAKDRCDKCFMVHSPGQEGCE